MYDNHFTSAESVFFLRCFFFLLILFYFFVGLFYYEYSPLGAECLQLAVQRGLHVLLGIEAHGRVELLVHQLPLCHFLSTFCICMCLPWTATASSCGILGLLALLCCLSLALVLFLVPLLGWLLFAWKLKLRLFSFGCLQKFFEKYCW